MSEYLIREDQLVDLADRLRNQFEYFDNNADINLITNKSAFNVSKLPDGLTSIGNHAFNNCSNLTITTIPDSVVNIADNAFYSCSKLTSLTFMGIPDFISTNAFSYCYNLIIINVPWVEGEVAGAPWGATEATINYNYVGE